MGRHDRMKMGRHDRMKLMKIESERQRQNQIKTNSKKSFYIKNQHAYGKNQLNRVSQFAMFDGMYMLAAFSDE